MRWFVGVALAFSIALAAGCEASSPGTGPKGIHPQPQPNTKFTSPCNAEACGSAPGSLVSPHCKPAGSGSCGWSEDDGSVSYRECPDADCGPKPDETICPPGTTYKGSQCGSENAEICRWSSACMLPPSTTPCPEPNGCGGRPELAVICQDGGVGDLLCMQLASGSCGWQRSCE